MSSESKELEGLRVNLDKLVHNLADFSSSEAEAGETSHAFIYFLSIHNMSDRSITLLGRKWVIQNADGTTTVVEGDKIVGETPTLAPGETFSYNSYHVTRQEASATGSFHGVDEFEQKIHVRIPEFRLKIPETPQTEEGPPPRA